MNITINGEQTELHGLRTISQLLEHLGVPIKGVAVERNLEIVPRSRLAHTALAEGDRIEIVSFVGGG